MNYIKRSIEDTFLKINQQYAAILLTGPRQVGKTTMLKKLMSSMDLDRTYISLDDLNERNLAISDPALFFQIHQPPVFIDEVQYAPQLFPYIKILIDRNHQPGDFWLTGSQIIKLMDGVQESLAGRVALLHMVPLSQQEIYQDGVVTPFAVNMDQLLEKQKHTGPVSTPELYERIFHGGMPALVSGKYTDRSVFLCKLHRHVSGTRCRGTLWDHRFSKIPALYYSCGGPVCAIDQHQRYRR